jgi:hypothetical protein
MLMNSDTPDFHDPKISTNGHAFERCQKLPGQTLQK